MTGWSFEVVVSENAEPPQGYFFLCTPVSLISKPFSLKPDTYRWPTCPAYWSLDPSGIERLSTQEATALGFPSFEVKTEICVQCWDASVYAGLRQFHQAKGFDPDSQNVALHMDHPLLQLAGEAEAPFAHVTAEHPGFWADDEDWNLGFADYGSEDRQGLPAENLDEKYFADGDLCADQNQQKPFITHHEYGSSQCWGTHQDPQPVSPSLNFLIIFQFLLILLASLLAAVSNGVRE
ncbi:hypothetical protein DFH06DRAFT_1180047 [Mycena polygramma]|nr:hypothetical protein DFH06DRAFT_1180047 [Mycena polygramma]